MKTVLKYLFWVTIYALAITSPAWGRAALAHADPDSIEPVAVTYTAQRWKAVCYDLDADPTFDGVTTTALHLINAGKLTVQQAGEVIGLSVRIHCIQHAPLLARFVAANQPAPERVLA